MKYIKADLLNSVVGSYDQTKTTIQGLVNQRTEGGISILAPPSTEFIDVFTDTGLTPAGPMYLSTNGRLFFITAPAAGIARIALYNFNLTTGAASYVGNIQVNLPNVAATTHILRRLRVIDTGTTGWKILLTTVGSVAINGGLFLMNSIDLADFTPLGTVVIPFASGNNQKAVYLLQDPANIGVNQLNIASIGMAIDTATTRAYVFNGTAAIYQYYVYDYSIAPTYTQTTGVTIDSVTDNVLDTGHTYQNNDPIILRNLVGGTGLTTNTVYFVRNPVAGVSYQLSATSGGAVINVTLNGTGDFGRAFGTTGSNFVHKTSNLPALTGTIVADSVRYAMPAHSVNAGFACSSLGTTSNLYLGKLSELTSGATTWPSLATANLLGGVNEVTAPSATYCMFSNSMDRFFYVSNTATVYSKQLVNNLIDFNFGKVDTTYLEGKVGKDTNFGLLSYSGMDVESGWIIACQSAVAGQRVIIKSHIKSDKFFDYSYIVTKVLNTPNSQLAALKTIEAAFAISNTFTTYYRTSGFGSITGGWTLFDYSSDLTSIATSTQIQFKFAFSLTELTSYPPHLNEVELLLNENNGISDNWEFSDDWSDNNVPSRCTFRLKTAYTTSVPQLFFRAYDLSDALLVNHNTTTNAANFEYSTNNGVSWIPLGTVPNTVGTLVRYTFTSPPGVDIRPGIRET